MTAPRPGEDLQSPAGGTATAPAEACPHCHKPPTLCVCDGIVPIDNKVSAAHPAAPAGAGRDARHRPATALQPADATLKIGLSWPSLSKILGRTADPQRWAVLYLGSVKPATVAPDRELVVVNRKGHPVAGPGYGLAGIEGVIVLTAPGARPRRCGGAMPGCSNAGVSCSVRAQPSRYGRLRREPRRDGLSTIEATAMLLARLERRPESRRR